MVVGYGINIIPCVEKGPMRVHYYKLRITNIFSRVNQISPMTIEEVNISRQIYNVSVLELLLVFSILHSYFDCFSFGKGLCSL